MNHIYKSSFFSYSSKKILENSAIGFCNERLRLYLADELVRVENPRPKDADEVIELMEVTLEEALALIASGDICDAKTIMAIQYMQIIRK